MNNEMLLSTKLDIPEITRAIFHPRKEQLLPAAADAVNLSISVPDSLITLGCRLFQSDVSSPTIIFFHGNGETVGDYEDVARMYMKRNINLFMATYRGYGWSSGEPVLSSLFTDNAVIFSTLMEYRKENDMTGPLFCMGRSLGSASAIDLVFRFQDHFKGLLLESAFADTLPLAQRLGYDIAQADIQENECFNNVTKIKEITLPTMLLHGAKDQIIPVHEAEKLQAESGARTKQFHVIPGADHNSLLSIGGELYFDTIKQFIDTVTGNNNWRERRKQFKKK